MGKIKALSLIRIQSKYSEKVIESLRKIEEIDSITLLTGEFDGILEIKIEEMEELYKIFEKIDKIEGINETNTHVVMKEFISD
jgi:DNA-binding Lrp family transcriptional regulator